MSSDSIVLNWLNNEIKLKPKVENIIEEFSIYMPRLFQKIENLDEYIEKLSEYANVYVDDDENGNKGFVVFYSNDMVNNIGFVSLIVVKESFRKLGIGKALIQSSCDVMKENKMGRIGLVVDKCNINAIGFYEHLGFEFIKEEKTGYYMEKNL